MLAFVCNSIDYLCRLQSLPWQRLLYSRYWKSFRNQTKTEELKQYAKLWNFIRRVKRSSQAWSSLCKCVFLSCPTYPENFMKIHSPSIMLRTNTDPKRKVGKQSFFQGVRRNIAKMFHVVRHVISDISWKFRENPFVHFCESSKSFTLPQPANHLSAKINLLCVISTEISHACNNLCW